MSHIQIAKIAPIDHADGLEEIFDQIRTKLRSSLADVASNEPHLVDSDLASNFADALRLVQEAQDCTTKAILSIDYYRDQLNPGAAARSSPPESLRRS